METGDVLGACVFDPDDTTSGVTTYRLDIVSRAALGSEDLVRTNTDPSSPPAGCSATTVPGSFDRGASGTGSRSSTSRSLHLWANIEVATTEAPTMVKTTTMEATTMEVTTSSTTTSEPTEDTTTPEDVTTDMTTAGGPLITDGDSTTSTTNQGTTSNPDANTAQPIGGEGGGSNVATVAIAVVVALIIVIALVAILILVLLRRRSKALHSIKNSEVPDKSGRETAVDLKSNETYGIHGEPRDTPTDYENPFGQPSTTQQPNDVTYEEVPGPIHYNDPCQPIPLENNEAYGVHKSAQMAETCSQEVDLKSNEAYGVRGEVQVAAINGTTTDAVCYSVIDSPGQQYAEIVSGIEIRMDSNEAYGTSERDRETEETLDYDYAFL
ncbi:uncharacterized protein LOC135335114 isoform X3 [Halichondria panicea]|uniref:uncharacterized protein LOC135335114 isoform X3 n=1 Tax=Halichondria panicea TaxID=6063 RepID=UPI00312B4D57